VKALLPLTLLACTALAGCNTLANKRDLYSPSKGKGPYTNQLRAMDANLVFDDTPYDAPSKRGIYVSSSELVPKN